MKTGANRKIQVVEIPQIRTIKKYDNFYKKEVKTNGRKNKNTNKRKGKKELRAVDMKEISKLLLYVGVLFIFMMLQMYMSYEVAKLGKAKVESQKRLTNIKREVENLEREYLSNFDLKKMEEKSKELGFVYNDTIKYIKVD